MQPASILDASLSRKLIIPYLLLVGLPLLGLMGVLGVGRGVTPPPSVGGIWDVQVDHRTGEAQHCAVWSEFTRSSTLEIMQSGRYLTLTLGSQPKISVQATLDGGSLISASSSQSSKLERDCSSDAGLLLIAKMDAAAKPQVISGTVSASGCPACGSINFLATRRTSSSVNKRSE
jgi:hypothetical protein